MSDPTTLPLLQSSDLVNVGGFTVPNTDANGSFNYGGDVMAFSSGSLLLGNGYKVAQISIPAPLVSGSVKALPRASYVKPFASVLGSGRGDGVGPAKADKIGGLLVLPDRVIASAYVYYDANNTQLRSHARLNPDLTDRSSPRVWSQVWQAKKAGFVAGPMTHIPPEWQALLGGSALTGLSCIPIVTRTSFGPSAFAFDPLQVGQPTVPAQPLVYYPSDHPTLGPWSGSNPTYGATTLIGGMVIVPGTRTLLFFGSNGVGEHIYGYGTSDKTLHGKPHPQGEKWAYDPTDSAKGSHAYPYKYQVWAYDLSDCAAVKAGTKQPWEVKPYGVWPIDLPINHAFQVRFASVAIDPVSRRIYAAQYKGESTATGDGQPIVWAFDPKVSTPVPVPPPPPPPPPPLPPPSEVETLKAEVAALQIQLAAERATIVVMHQQLADAEARGDATAVALAAMRAERDAALKRHADLLAALKALLAQ